LLTPAAMLFPPSDIVFLDSVSLQGSEGHWPLSSIRTMRTG
jgi:hypothetical protein